MVGVSSKDFYDMEPVEMHYCLQYKMEIQRQQNTLIVRTIYESMRLQTLRLLQANPHLKTKPKKLEQVFQFTWDKKKQTWEEILSAFGSFSRRHNKQVEKEGTE